MISEIPIAPEPTPEPMPEPEVNSVNVPKAQVVQDDLNVPKAESEPINSVNVPQAHPEPKRKVGRPKKDAQPAQVAQVAQAAPFTINDLSSAQLVAELVQRRRANERSMRAELYRSWVM